jgi:hypothetical protein
MRILDETIYEGTKRYIYAVGTSSEAKPTENIATGSVYYEVNTSKAYMFNETNNTWFEMGGGA